MTDPEPDNSLVIDEFGQKLAAFQALRKSDAAAADGLLNSLGAQERAGAPCGAPS